MTPDELRQALSDYRYHVGRRDELVRLAYEAGVEKTEISRLSGISRVTINKILGAEPGDD